MGVFFWGGKKDFNKKTQYLDYQKPRPLLKRGAWARTKSAPRFVSFHIGSIHRENIFHAGSSGKMRCVTAEKTRDFTTSLNFKKMIFAPPEPYTKIIFLKDKRARAIFPSAFGFIVPLFVCLILKARPTLFFRAGSLIVKAQLLSINKGWYVFPKCLETGSFEFQVIIIPYKKSPPQRESFCI